MRDNKELAVKLRKQGKSYNEISKELGIPKSTISGWFANKDWSIEIKAKLERHAVCSAKRRLSLINARKRKCREELREKFKQEAINEFPLLFQSPLFVAGINLYWGEGHNKRGGGRVELANTDPKMISLFAKFIIKIAKVPKDKIRVWLILYPDLSEKKCKTFWSKTSGIPQSQFYKTQFIKGKHPTKRIEHGVCEIQTYSVELKEKIFVWTEMLYNELAK